LHASILDTSESLRSEHPGIERFKIAAARNITQWSNAELHLPYPYQVYNPTTNSFETVNAGVNPAHKPTNIDTDLRESGTVFTGPFAYFLTTTNVDRLEIAFRITPLATSLPPAEAKAAGSDGSSSGSEDSGGWMDVVMIRPLIGAKSSTVRSSWEEDEELRTNFASTTMKVLQAAYQDGAHVQMTVDNHNNGEGESANGSGVDRVLEYLRVKEWEWKPVRIVV
jgi:hypothetical protein